MAKTDAKTAATASTADECAHHWQIETPSGETSRGVCKICGASRDFYNSQPPAPSRTARSAGSR